MIQCVERYSLDFSRLVCVTTDGDPATIGQKKGAIIIIIDILVTDMHAHVTAFEVNLRLWVAQLANGRSEHSPRLAACVPDDVEP